MQWPQIKPRVMMLIPGINMIWNLIIDYVLQQLEINVKLISSYSMHHYMVAYLLDFKGMLITHNPILRGAGDPCSDECACACTCLNITGWALFFVFFISSPGLLVFASETRADVSESMCFIICTYFSSTPHKAEFLRSSWTWFCDRVWHRSVATWFDQRWSVCYIILFFFFFLSALAAVNMLFSNSLCDCNPDGNKNPFGCSKLNYKMSRFM